MMGLAPRWRILLVLTLACFIGWLTISWGWIACAKLVDYYARGGIYCVGSWRDLGNGGCGSRLPYSGVLGVAEVILCIGLLVVLGWLSAQWALRPFRAMADTVGRFGPTSMGLRINATGSRDEHGALAAAIDAMLDRVAAGYDSQRRFAATASHELRTPLATQRTLIEVSLASALTPDQLQLLSRQLLATNERNENLIEGLLALAETERGLMASGHVRLDLLAADVVERLRPEADKAGLRIDAELLETPVTGEQALVERLAMNLVHNAIKYNEAGGWVRVATRQPGTLTVANSGPVVPAQDVASLFEPFRRLTGERLEHGGGVGLGLTIVRSIVAAHGGEIHTVANPEGGLTVTVHLS